ncbi:MAG: helix-turn-helix transcriptional regulator [Candidatus Nanoarchaeia archaeon]
MEVSIKKIVLALGSVFILGVLFAIANGIYAEIEDSSLPLFVYLIAFVSLLTGVFISVLFQWKINKIQLERILKILPQEERKVVSLLIENNNSLEQNKLVALTGIHKVKMSRLLSELEVRGIIKKSNLGNTNLVVLAI